MEHDEVSEEYLLNIRREKTARELDRIRNSFSISCGKINSKCLRITPLIMIIPFCLFGFIFVYILERLGRRLTHQVSSGVQFKIRSVVLCSFPPTASA